MWDNLLDPVVLCFAVGVLGGLLKSDLRLPDQLYESLSIYLLFALGLKGGVELAKAVLSDLAVPLAAAILLGVLVPIVAYSILRKIGRFNQTDSGSIAAHYGSVSAVTFAVVLSFLAMRGVAFEPYVTVLLVVLEIPAIVVGILLAKYKMNAAHAESPDHLRSEGSSSDIVALLHEIFLSKSIYLLLAGLAVGFLTGPQRIEPVELLFFDLFKGALAFFLLEMGIITSRRLSELKGVGVFLAAFAIIMPVLGATMGMLFGILSGLSMGGTTVLAALGGSASYITAPAAIRMSLPKANPTLSLTAVLGITFPFNIVFGIPLYFWMVSTVYQIGGF